MIVVTGAAGFIGSALAWRLNTQNKTQLLLVDDLETSDRWLNLSTLTFSDYMEKSDFLDWLRTHPDNSASIKVIFHLGACSSTTETDTAYLMENNFRYTQTLAKWCVRNQVPLIYASSAATYGDGSRGYADQEEGLHSLRPLNRYGYSKQIFDLWARQAGILKQIVGLKYFNVYGPNEYQKGDMRSVVLKSFEQIRLHGKVQLFKSHREDYADGCQLRDFIYIQDAVDMTLHCWQKNVPGGIYNIGTGTARSWIDLVTALFNALNLEPDIEFIPMPDSIRDKYQYYTQADMRKFFSTGYAQPIRSLEEGVADYVKHLSAGCKNLGEI